MTWDENYFYMKIVGLDEIYNFRVSSFFLFEVIKMLEK
jgi:hypothetical protein